HYSLDLEFENDEIISGATVQRDGRRTLDDLLGWLDQNHEKRFFIWAHFFDPHLPYTPPEPYSTLYALDPYSGEVAYTDALVGELVDKLDALGHESDTIVAIVGDHGESRGDHDEKYHGLFIYDSTLQVPFLLRAPGIPHGKIEDQVRIIDIMPTLLDLLHMESPSFKQGEGLVKGQSLTPLLYGAEKSLNLLAYSESHYPKLHYGWSNLLSLRSGRYKYIQAPRPELYDLSSDPRELQNLIDTRPEIAARMRQNLEELGRCAGRAALNESEPAKGDVQTAEALRALGYTGSVSPGTQKEGETLADPKDKIDLLNRLEQAERLIASGEPSRAIPLIEQVVKEEPQMTDARISLGVALIKINDFPSAAHVFEQILEYDGANFIALMNLGMCRQRLGQETAAQELFTQAIAVEPTHQKAVDTLVDSYLRSGRMKEAVSACERFLELKPESIPIRVRLARSLFNMGRTRDAKKTVEKGLEMNSAGADLNYLMGKIWEDRGKYEEAAEAYGAELRHHKNNADAYQSLASVLERSKAWDKIIPLLEEGTAEHPEHFPCHLLLARAYFNTGNDHEKAVATARRALELNPSSQEARSLLEALQEK
ncbi:MAG: tetratricopeptide repeat protein, partial [Planctomycetota bacterium]